MEKKRYAYYLYPKTLFNQVNNIQDFNNAVEDAYPEWVYPNIPKSVRQSMFMNILIMLRKDQLKWKAKGEKYLPREIPKSEFLQLDINREDYLIRKWTVHYGKRVQGPDNAFGLDPINYFSKIVQERIDALYASTSKRRKK